eukprot:gene24954-biopygen1416
MLWSRTRQICNFPREHVDLPKKPAGDNSLQNGRLTLGRAIYVLRGCSHRHGIDPNRTEVKDNDRMTRGRSATEGTLQSQPREPSNHKNIYISRLAAWDKSGALWQGQATQVPKATVCWAPRGRQRQRRPGKYDPSTTHVHHM